MTAKRPPAAFPNPNKRPTLARGSQHLEEVLRSTQELTQAVMDSLAAHVAVLDQDGVIIATNSAWGRFARENSPEPPRNTGIGVNYLGICHGACGESADGASEAEQGIRNVLSGAVPEFYFEYPCHSPDEQRWFLLQATGLAGGARGAVLLHINITERKLIEGRLLDAERLKVLTTGLLRGQEDERRRLARELHDGLNQQVAVLSIELGMLARETADPVRAQIKEMQQRALDLSEQVRRISHRLHPAALEHAGLVAALRALAAEFSGAHGIEIDLSIGQSIEEPDRDRALCLYRVAQESFANIAHHSGSAAASLRLRTTDGGAIELTIEDDGKGFDVAEVRRSPGLGLASIEERVRLAGGSLAVTAEPGSGTRVQAILPGTVGNRQ